jgi:hypothetical protein
MKNMSREETGVPRDFVLKQIENEIHAGFTFVAAACRALKLSHPAEAESALSEASETHAKAAHELADSAAAQVRSIVRQLTELREAVDWLRETHVARAAGK